MTVGFTGWGIGLIKASQELQEDVFVWLHQMFKVTSHFFSKKSPEAQRAGPCCIWKFWGGLRLSTDEEKAYTDFLSPL